MRGTLLFLGIVGIALFITGLPQIAIAQQGDHQKQNETGSISGQVVDRNGSLLYGVKVTLEGRALEEPIEEETNGLDNFEFEGLAPGYYQLTVALAGFITVNQEGIPVEPGKELVLEITMNPVRSR